MGSLDMVDAVGQSLVNDLFQLELGILRDLRIFCQLPAVHTAHAAKAQDWHVDPGFTEAPVYHDGLAILIRKKYGAKWTDCLYYFINITGTVIVIAQNTPARR